MTNLREWCEQNIPGDEMLWKGGFGQQVSFVRDTLNALVWRGVPYDDRGDVSVVSTHRSKSIILPVYELARPDLGIRVILRNNFHDWKVSVISELLLEVDLTGLCYTAPPTEPSYTGDHLNPVYFEGFPGDLIFGYYHASDHKRWSMELYGEESVYTALFLIMRAAGAVRPMLYHTRESHRIELDRDREAYKRAEARRKAAAP